MYHVVQVVMSMVIKTPRVFIRDVCLIIRILPHFATHVTFKIRRCYRVLPEE